MIHFRRIVVSLLGVILPVFGASAAIPSTEYVDQKYVPKDTKINNQSLSGNVNLTGANVAVTGYQMPATTAPVAATDSVNTAVGKIERALQGKANSTDIPTVNDATLTIKQNGATKGTFTANQGTAAEINLTDTTYGAGNNMELSGTTFNGVPAYGTSSTAAATATKVVSIPSITELKEGQIIVVKPTITSTVASTAISLNDFGSKLIRYNGAATTAGTAGYVWNNKYPSAFMYDGTEWHFIGGYDLNTNTTTTTGATNKTDKLYLVGAPSQGTAPTTYSRDTVFVDADGHANSKTPTSDDSSTKVATTEWAQPRGNYLTSYTETDPLSLHTAQGTTNAKKVISTSSTGAVGPHSITGSGSVSVTVADSGDITIAGTTYTLSGLGGVPTTRTVNGKALSSDITLSASDVGAAAAGHNHDGVYSPVGHTHTSSDVDAMTGYSKPSTTSAIAATDTLNAAIGKLEKALDGKQASGSYVTINTAQTISGAKTFTGTTIVPTPTANTHAANKSYVDSAVSPKADDSAVVHKAGDTMTGNLQMSDAGVYLTSIGSSVSQSTSRLNLGAPSSVYSYLTGNTSGAFGIYSELSGTRQGVACYPGTSCFADSTTKTVDLGRSSNVWKTGYIDSLSDGTNTVSVAALAGKQDASTAVTHTASTAVGSATQPVYIASDGKATATTYTLGASVPSNAKFTDTTYSAMTGATASAAGATGLVPAPAAGDQAKVLSGAGTWVADSDHITSASTTGSGNVVTAVTADADGKLTITKGITALTSHQDISGKADKSELPTKLSELTDDIDAVNVLNSVKLNGTALTVSDKAVNIPTMGAATASAAGATGLVPAPAAGAQAKFLRGDGTWATALTSHQTIKQDGVTGATVNRYGTCSTAAATAAKTASITTGTFNLETGAKVTIKFANKNTAASPTLAVNSTAAKAIYHNGAAITSANAGLLNGVCDFVYDGTQWNLVGNYIDTDTNTNTDTLVTQSVSTANDKYPLLATSTANATTNQGAKTSIFGSGVTLNPSTSTVYATTFSGKATSAGVADSANSVAWANVSGKPTLATVATSGSYNDLTNKPTITDTKVTQSAVTTSAAYPILFAPSASPTSGTATTAGYGSGITINPSTKTITATTFSGKATSAGVADSANSVAWANVSGKPTLATVATSGSYNDLTNKPTIPAAQVNSDWDATSGVAQILNKPTLATVATSGSYNDLANKPTIDSALSSTSTNAVQNKVVNSALAGKLATAQGTTNAKKVISTSSTGAVGPHSITGSGSVSVTIADSGDITITGTTYTLSSLGAAADSDVVHKTGDETITGTKTFKGPSRFWGTSTSDRATVQIGPSSALDIWPGTLGQWGGTTVTDKLLATNSNGTLGYIDKSTFLTSYTETDPLSVHDVDAATKSDTSVITFVTGVEKDATTKNLKVATADVKTMTGATSSAAGATGLVPAPAAGAQAKFLRGDGTWATALTSYTETDPKSVHTANETQSIAGQKTFTGKEIVNGTSSARATAELGQYGDLNIITGALGKLGGTTQNSKLLATNASGQLEYINKSTFLTSHQDISGKADKSELPTKLSELTDDIDAANVLNSVKLNGTALTVSDKAVNIPTMGAATASAAGATGLVPAPAAGAQAKFLRGDGTWATALTSYTETDPKSVHTANETQSIAGQKTFTGKEIVNGTSSARATAELGQYGDLNIITGALGKLGGTTQNSKLLATNASGQLEYINKSTFLTSSDAADNYVTLDGPQQDIMGSKYFKSDALFTGHAAFIGSDSVDFNSEAASGNVTVNFGGRSALTQNMDATAEWNGYNTFNRSPTVPTPTASDDAANKGYVDSAVSGKANASHNHPTSQVNVLTGYSKSATGATGALTTSDTLNKALAKLENALDGKQASGSYLTSHQTIKQDGVTGATVNRYGTCSTAAATAAKTASITTGTFSLETGAKVTIKFTYANTAANPTLNINGTGAKNVYHRGVRITTGTNKALLAGVCDFVYDGTQWNLVGGNDSAVVHLADTETITGDKTFQGEVTFDENSVAFNQNMITFNQNEVHFTQNDPVDFDGGTVRFKYDAEMEQDEDVVGRWYGTNDWYGANRVYGATSVNGTSSARATAELGQYGDLNIITGALGKLGGTTQNSKLLATNASGQLEYINKAMTGATASAAGTTGLVPAPAAGANTKFLRGDGTWVAQTTPGSGTITIKANEATAGSFSANATSATTVTIPAATTTSSGVVKAGIGTNMDDGALTVTTDTVMLTNYTKPASAAALGDSITVNTALGYLEVKVDAAAASAASAAASAASAATDAASAVHKAGTETITGNKTFSGTVALGSNATATTQTAGNSSTKVATTAFVGTAVANSIPKVCVGSSCSSTATMYIE